MKPKEATNGNGPRTGKKSEQIQVKWMLKAQQNGKSRVVPINYLLAQRSPLKMGQKRGIPGQHEENSNLCRSHKMGKPEKRNTNKLQILDATIQQLIVCLQNLKETGISSEKGNNKRNFGKKFSGGRKRF